MCASSTPVKDAFVYKRRRMQRNSVALLSGKNAGGVTERNIVSNFNPGSADYHWAPPRNNFNNVRTEGRDHSCGFLDNGKPSLSGRNNLNVNVPFVMPKSSEVNNLEFGQPCKKHALGPAREITYSAERPIISLWSSSVGNCNGNNVPHHTLKSHVPHAELLTVPVEHNGEFSSSRAIPLESMENITSPEDMCIYVLRKHGLLGENSRKSAAAFENHNSVEPVFIQCRICSLPENVLKMLICDDCDRAFHLSCCRPKIKKLPIDEWYCQSCLKKKWKHLPRKNMGNDLSVQAADDHLGPISSILRDIHPYRSRVRVGGDFQIEVLDWSGPITINDDYFGETKEMDPADCCSLKNWRWSKQPKQSLIGNWLQCQDEDDDGNKCGKWRRAPLFAVQTDNWDCSCAVPWDPLHADCAVPQEVDIEVVLKHLKYVEMLKARLNNRAKPVNGKCR